MVRRIAELSLATGSLWLPKRSRDAAVSEKTGAVERPRDSGLPEEQLGAGESIPERKSALEGLRGDQRVYSNG
jgi:hypothetical protein